MNAISRRIPFRLTPFSVFGLLLAVVGCGTIAVDIRTEIISQQEIKQNIEYTISGPIAALFITDGEIDLGAEADLGDLEALEQAGWDFEMDVTQIDGDDALRMRLGQTFTGEDAAEQFRLASLALAEQDTSSSMIPFLDITETEDEIVYDLRMSVSVDDEAVVPASGFDEPFPTVEPLMIDGTSDFPDPDALGDLGAFDDAFNDGLEDFTEALEASFDDFISVKWTVEMPGLIQESNATTEEGSTLTWDVSFADLSDGGDELFARSAVNKNAGGGSCNI